VAGRVQHRDFLFHEDISSQRQLTNGVFA
jgi:hypothetical protein